MVTMYIDDIREPLQSYDVIARSYDEAISYIQKNGIPNFISFDHDLGLDKNGDVAKSGYDVAKWLVESSLDGTLEFPDDFSFYVHSANPVGKTNIESIIKNYLKFSDAKKHIRLKDAPLLLAFLTKLLAFDKTFEIQMDLANELEIIDRCTCGQKDCATVYLKRDKDWCEEQLGAYVISTTKGIIIIHLDYDGSLEIEALENKYPYRYEVERVLNGDFSQPRQCEWDELQEYFQDLEKKELPVHLVE